MPIHKDATLKIRPRLFLEGNFFVDMTAGTPGRPTIDDGDTIPVTQTAYPVQLDQHPDLASEGHAQGPPAPARRLRHGLAYSPTAADDVGAGPGRAGRVRGHRR